MTIIVKLIATPRKPWTLKSGRIILEPELDIDVVTAIFFSTTIVVWGTVVTDPLESVVAWLGIIDVNVVFVVITLAFSGIDVGVNTSLIVDVEIPAALRLRIKL